MWCEPDSKATVSKDSPMWIMASELCLTKTNQKKKKEKKFKPSFFGFISTRIKMMRAESRKHRLGIKEDNNFFCKKTLLAKKMIIFLKVLP